MRVVGLDCSIISHHHLKCIAGELDIGDIFCNTENSEYSIVSLHRTAFLPSLATAVLNILKFL